MKPEPSRRGMFRHRLAGTRIRLWMIASLMLLAAACGEMTEVGGDHFKVNGVPVPSGVEIVHGDYDWSFLVEPSIGETAYQIHVLNESSVWIVGRSMRHWDGEKVVRWPLRVHDEHSCASCLHYAQTAYFLSETEAWGGGTALWYFDGEDWRSDPTLCQTTLNIPSGPGETRPDLLALGTGCAVAGEDGSAIAAEYARRHGGPTAGRYWELDPSGTHLEQFTPSPREDLAGTGHLVYFEGTGGTILHPYGRFGSVLFSAEHTSTDDAWLHFTRASESERFTTIATVPPGGFPWMSAPPSLEIFTTLRSDAEAVRHDSALLIAGVVAESEDQALYLMRGVDERGHFTFLVRVSSGSFEILPDRLYGYEPFAIALAGDRPLIGVGGGGVLIGEPR